LGVSQIQAPAVCQLSARNYCLLHTSQVHCLPIHFNCTLKTDTFLFCNQDILTNTPEVGRLYPSQDYARAGALTSELLTDEDEWQRQRKSCRDAVEEWSWMASNRKLRDSQYAVAIARFTRIRRQAIILSLLRSRRRTAAVVRAVLKHQWLLTLCVYTVCVVGLASARHVLLQDGFTYASGAGFENAASSLRTVTAFCGPFAPAVAVTVIAFVSIMPFVPVSPLLALCGLMFGVKQGALIGLLGMTEASAVAFTFARQMGFQKMAAVVAGTALGLSHIRHTLVYL
jgi:sulfoquinovosyltransferase